jgi:hypothetical protein
MRRRICAALIQLLTACLFLIFYPQVVTGAEIDLLKYLPKEDEVEGWKKYGSSAFYKGESLYEYINGGAEIYHEYGFEQVVVQDYINEAGKTVSIEIFLMKDSESAFGIYSFKTDTEGKKVPVGQDGQLADYYMNFWKGAILVTLTGFDETGETVRGLLDMAEKVDTKVEVIGQKPPMVSLLPQENLVLQSEKYFEGFLGLMNSYPFFSFKIKGFEAGVKGDYTDGYSLFLFRYLEAEDCLASYGRMKKNYEGTSGYLDYESEETGFFRLKDKRERQAYLSSYGKYLLLLLGELGPAQAEDIFQSLRFSLDIPG